MQHSQQHENEYQIIFEAASDGLIVSDLKKGVVIEI